MRWIATLTLCLVYSCASGPNYEKQHAEYLDQVREAQERMSKQDFGHWLKRQLKSKEAEFAAFGGLMHRQNKIHSNHEQRSARAQGDNDVYEHKVRTSEIQMRRYDVQRKYLERQIFLLKGLLAKYDSPFVP